jgi:hypothetical protein
MIGINIRTAQHYIKKYHDDEEKCLPVGGNKQISASRTNKLAEEHSKFLVEYIYERLAAVLSKIRHHLVFHISSRVDSYIYEETTSCSYIREE